MINVIDKYFNEEIIHFSEDNHHVMSTGNTLKIIVGDCEFCYKMPPCLVDYFGKFRLVRRLLRLDKCNVFPVCEEFIKFIVIRQGIVYLFDRLLGTFDAKLKLKNCRNVLHNSICLTPGGTLIFGEYGANLECGPVPLHISKNGGETWLTVDLFGPDEIKHIHCVTYDKYNDNVWVTTGDYDGQCKILICDESLNIIEILGDGSQYWRTCGVFFERESVYWFMDSPLIQSHLIKYDRKTKEIEKCYPTDGPVWYAKRLSDGVFVAGVTVEPGASVQTKCAQLIASNDLIDWKVIAEFPKDVWSMKYFKYGVLCFSEGQQSSDSFCVFGEALVGFDGIGGKFSIPKDHF